tara:strand:- start:2745 stop:3245 length:501 start_codon:yes stop_codon:yes gene_type:complete
MPLALHNKSYIMNKISSLKSIIISSLAIFSMCGCSEEWWEHPGGVIAKNQLPGYVTDYLSKNSVLKNEDLLVMYDVTLSLDTSECAILTTRNFIYHKQGSGDIRVPYDDIIEVRIEDDILATNITFTSYSDQVSQVQIAAMNNAELFINTLKLKVSDNFILDMREN